MDPLYPASPRHLIRQSLQGTCIPRNSACMAPRFLTLTETSPPASSLPSTSGSHPRAICKAAKAPNLVLHCLGDDFPVAAIDLIEILIFFVILSASDLNCGFRLTAEKSLGRRPPQQT